MSTERLCGETAAIRIYWPGRPPMPVCSDHHLSALNIAAALGFYVHFDQAETGSTCESKVKERSSEA